MTKTTVAPKKAAPEKTVKAHRLNCQKVKQVMKLKKLSIADLADKTDLYYSHIWMILQGQLKHPRPKTVKAISKALGVSEKTLVKA